jgi:pyruvate dehydrogenase E2 component (dihydrolipoamide acetyltransferase)
VAAILVPSGSQDVKVGQPVLVLVDDAASIPAFANYKPGSSAGAGGGNAPPPPAASSQPQAASSSGASSASYPAHTKLAMPALSPTMTSGNIAQFKVKVGDRISPGDLICDIESDKATIGWESQVRSFDLAMGNVPCL